MTAECGAAVALFVTDALELAGVRPRAQVEIDEAGACDLGARHQRAFRQRGDAGMSMTTATRDASGLRNPAVWVALERKGLIRSTYPFSAVLTSLGREYETGMREIVLHKGSH